MDYAEFGSGNKRQGGSGGGSGAPWWLLGATVAVALLGFVLSCVALAKSSDHSCSSGAVNVQAPATPAYAAATVTAAASAQLLNNYNAMMQYWVYGNEALFKATVSSNVVMAIPAFQVNLTGPEALWTFRHTIATTHGIGPNDPLPWINTHDSAYVAGSNVYTFMKSFNISNAHLIQLGAWIVSYGPDGLATRLYQDVLYPKP